MTDDALVLTVGEILKATEGVLLRGSDGCFCRGISTDTRTLAQENLFIALKGDRFDGHDCLAEAARKGAAALLVRNDTEIQCVSLAEDIPIVGVADTLKALGAIAADWRKRFSVPLIAITGSSGKTTTKEMISSIAGRTKKNLKTEGNFNNQVGLPLTLLGLRKEHELVIVEMGTNSPGEIAALASIASPDVGLITNIGPAHLEGLGSMDAIRDEKGSLFEVMAGSGTAIFNLDDPAIRLLAKQWSGERVTFGLGPDTDVTARKIQPAGPEGIHFNLFMDGLGLPVFLATAGEHNVINAMAAAAGAMALGFDRQEIASGLAAFQPVPGRTDIRKLANGTFLISDTYNANPASVREAIKTLRGLKGSGNAIVILGDMLELGERSETLHGEIGALIADAGIHRLFLKGTLTKALADEAVRCGFPVDRIAFFEEPAHVVSSLRPLLKKGDWILIKGSRRMKMEVVAADLAAAFDLKGQTV